MKFLTIALSTLSFFANTAHAELAVKPIAYGVAGNSVFNGNDYCEDIYIQKTGGLWNVANASDESLKDDSYEKLRGCIGFLGREPNTTINAVIFSVATKDICETERRCEVNSNNKLATGCHQIFMKDFYKQSSPRSKGYFSCNSNFAGRRMLGGFDFDAPIKTEALISALESDSIKAAAASIAQSRYSKLLARALQSYSSDCGNCSDELDAIKFLFFHFSRATSAADLETAAFNYLAITGQRQVPNWMTSHLAAGTVEILSNKNEQEWRRKYAAQVQKIFDKKALQTFIQKYETPDPNNWGRVDFDNLVPQMRQRLDKLLAQEQAEANEKTRKQAETAERNRQAETKRIAEWRKSLQLGADTFCGPVIEMRAPMVKIAVRVQLQGFASEMWLKFGEVFPPEYGCRNTNGRLTPY